MNLNTFITCKPFIRRDFTSKDGTQAIYLRITIPKDYIVFTTGIRVNPTNWIKQTISKNETNWFEKNTRLKKLISRGQEIIDRYFFEGKTLTKQLFISEFFTSSHIYFFDWAFAKLEKMELGYGTRKAYRSKLNIFKKYVGNIGISDITSQMIEKYRNHLMNNTQNENSANKSIGIIKTFVNIAESEGLINKNPFNFVKIKEIKGNRTALSEKQVLKLENCITQLNESQKIILNHFLFACYTGLSYAEVYKLSEEHIITKVFDDEPTLFIMMKRTKTGNGFSVPLIPKAETILKTGVMFKKFTNKHTNDTLKDIAKIAGIKTNVTFHVARHTFATLALNKGVPMEVVSKLLGHSQIKTTEIYAKVSDQYKFLELKKLL